MTISVLIPSYNSAQYINRCIESILNQSYQDLKILFLNDGSKDNTLEILKNFNSDKIEYYANTENKGRGYSRNKLLNLSKTKYSVWCDVDDWMHEKKLEKQINYFIGNNCNFLATEMYDCDNYGNIVGNGINKKENIESLNYSKLLNTNCINHPTVMFETELARKIGFNENLRRDEDWDFYKKLYNEGYKVECLGEPLYYYKL